ncbi:MAG: endolytic transglycosylase MltG, partial [Oscillospiraceae bacterium]|nr:endolytic transglycosylase MltG [Oscillospiraceae bacterium]
MNQEEKFNTAKWDAKQVRKESAYPDRSSVRRRKKKRNGLRFWLVWCVFVLVTSAILAGVGWLLANDMCAFNKEPLTATVEVTKEDNIRTIAKKLEQEGLIEYKWYFKLFAAIRNAEDKIGVGTYELNTDMDYNALISGMRNTNAALSAETVRVSFPEGYSVRQIIERMV